MHPSRTLAPRTHAPRTSPLEWLVFLRRFSRNTGFASPGRRGTKPPQHRWRVVARAVKTTRPPGVAARARRARALFVAVHWSLFGEKKHTVLSHAARRAEVAYTGCQAVASRPGGLRGSRIRQCEDANKFEDACFGKRSLFHEPCANGISHVHRM